MKKKKSSGGVFESDLHEVKTAGFKATKREKNVNRRAGLHDKKKDSEGVTRVKRRKPLALKHVRRMRKAAVALSCVFVCAVAAVGVGLFKQNPVEDLPEVDYATVCFATPTDGSAPTAHTLVENVGYMNYVLQNQTYWSSEMESTVHTVMSQRVFTYKQYYGGVLISADIAQGVSSEATQFCVTDEVVLWRGAANKNFNGMNTPWSSGEPQGLTLSQYRQKRGLPPSEFSVYILNEKTIKNAADYSVSDNGDGTYTMTLDLSVNTGDGETSADYFYKQQMLVTGGLDEHPVIEETQVTYVFDKDWRILSFTITDSYSAKMGISVHCTSETHTTFSYKEEDAQNTFYDDYFKKYENNFAAAPDPDSSEPNALNYLAAAFGSVLTDGATFKLDLTVGELDLGGAVYVGLSDGALSDVRAKLGEIGIYIDKNLTLYVTDGVGGYKLAVGDMFASASGDEGSETDALAGLDVNAIVDKLASGTFTVNGDVSTLDTNLEIFGLNIALKFEFDTADGVKLGFVSAEIPFNEQLIKARLEFGTKDDIPELPADLDQYTDVLNNGLSLKIALSADELNLDGIAQILMSGGEFAGVRAKLGDFGVYYDSPADMLYLTDGKVGYKLALSAIRGGDIDLGAITGALDTDGLLRQIIENISTGKGTVSTGATLEILEQTITAALGVKLTGGIGVNANIELFGKKVTADISLTDETVALPDFTHYIDVLNEGLTFDIGLTLDEVKLDGAVFIGFKDGKFAELRADFGGIAVYYLAAPNELYIRAGTTKAMIALGKTEDSSALDIPALLGGDVPKLAAELIGNLAAALKEVSTSADIKIMDSVVPVEAKLDFGDGIKISAKVSMLGIDVLLDVIPNGDNAKVALPDFISEGYVDVLKEGWELADNLLGEKLTATVTGNLYRPDDNNYVESGYEKYYFKASLEYDKGYTLDANGQKVANGFPVHIETGVKEEGKPRTGMNFYLDSTLYLHFNLLLQAKSANDDSLYLDVYLMDATPVSTANGRTGGSYAADGVLDVYVKVSKYAPGTEGYDPLMLYAPANEIMSLAAMAGSAANLDKLEFKDSKELTEVAAEISDIVSQLLIEKYIPKTKDQFASLGDSLIPQILGGKNLNALLNNLIGNVGETVEGVKNGEFRLDGDYIKSVTHGKDSLNLVLNSSAIYNTEMSEADDITVELNRGKIDGVNYLTDARIRNVFCGDNEEHKLNIALALGYGDIAKPAALKDYLNLDGIDVLLKSFVNSATHETTGGDAKYDLNRYYLLNGSLDVGLNVMSLATIDLKVTVNSLSVYIDKSDDENVADKVHADVHISYPGKKAKLIGFIPATAINGTTDVYISVKEDMIYIKRIQTTDADNKPITPVTETRIMPLDEFLGDIMNQLGFLLNMAPIISDNLGKVDTSGGSGGISFDGYDFGKTLNSILSYYTYTETDTSAQWNIGINGQLLKDLAGMTADAIPVSFKADKNADGTLTVKGLDISKTEISIPLVGKSGVNITLSANFNYCNPNENIPVGEDGKPLYEDTTQDLVTAKGGLEELDGRNWSQVLGAEEYKEILKNTNWKLLLADTGKNYLGYGNGSDLAVAELKYVYSTDTADNAAFKEFGTRQFVLYNSSNLHVYTYLKKPSLSVMTPPAGKTAVWSDTVVVKDGMLVKQALYDVTHVVRIDSDYKTNDAFSYEDGVWRRTVDNAYKRVYLEKDVLYADGDLTYRIKGYSLTAGGELIAFGESEITESGELCYVAEVNGDVTYYAVWEQVYAVNYVAEYVDEAGATVKTEQTVYYFAGEKLSERMPEAPVRTGWTVVWDTDPETTVAANSDITVKAGYTVNSYSVNIISSIEVTDAGFVNDSGSGTFVNSTVYEFGTAGKLPETLTPKSPAYVFGGIYDNQAFSGKPVTDFTVFDRDANYYVKWIGKTLTVAYTSDETFGDAASGETTEIDGKKYYIDTKTLTYGKDNALANFVVEGRKLLGWFMLQEDNTYKYYASADDLLTAYEQKFAETTDTNINVTLWAVWVTDVAASVDSLERNNSFVCWTWTVKFGYSGAELCGEKSKEIGADSFNVSATALLKLLNDNKEEITTLNNGNEYKIKGNPQTEKPTSLKTDDSGNASYASVTITVNITCGGAMLKLVDTGYSAKR